MDIVYLHERGDEILVFLLFNISDVPICRSNNAVTDSTFRVTEENQEKNQYTKNRDKEGEEPKRKPTEYGKKYTQQ
jgi:hypothetical protein